MIEPELSLVRLRFFRNAKWWFLCGSRVKIVPLSSMSGYNIPLVVLTTSVTRPIGLDRNAFYKLVKRLINGEQLINKCKAG